MIWRLYDILVGLTGYYSFKKVKKLRFFIGIIIELSVELLPLIYVFKIAYPVPMDCSRPD